MKIRRYPYKDNLKPDRWFFIIGNSIYGSGDSLPELFVSIYSNRKHIRRKLWMIGMLKLKPSKAE